MIWEGGILFHKTSTSSTKGGETSGVFLEKIKIRLIELTSAIKIIKWVMDIEINGGIIFRNFQSMNGAPRTEVHQV